MGWLLLAIAGILVCRYGAANNISKDVLSALRIGYPHLTFRTVIRENVRLRESPSHGKPIFAYAPKCPGALDYLSLVREVLGEAALAAA